MTRRLAPLGLALLLVTCTEDLTAPGVCPDFCPSTSLAIVDTVLAAAVSGDSSFGRPNGFVNPWGASELLAADVPALSRDSRPIFRTTPLSLRVSLSATDSGNVIGVDSIRLGLVLLARDTTTHNNLRLALYQLPLAMDSTTTLADVATPFSNPPVRTIYLDSLLAHGVRNTDTLGKSTLTDAVTGDVLAADTLHHRITLRLVLDSTQAPLVPADSGKVAFGIRVSADSLASAAFGSSEAGALGPILTWYLKVDSLGMSVAHRAQARSASASLGGFDTFVFTAPTTAIGSDLVTGGIPAARGIVRLTLPKAIRDSSHIIRATLECIPTAPLTGIPADSFLVIAYPVIADFGAKSPRDVAHTDTTHIAIGPMDTVRLDVTNVLRQWTADTAAPSTLILQQFPEGADFVELRVHRSSDTAFRPRLHIIYTPLLLSRRP